MTCRKINSLNDIFPTGPKVLVTVSSSAFYLNKLPDIISVPMKYSGVAEKERRPLPRIVMPFPAFEISALEEAGLC